MKLTALLSFTCLLYAGIANNTVSNINTASAKFSIAQTNAAAPTGDSALVKIYKHKMPILLSEVKTILGKEYKFIKPVLPTDRATYIWDAVNGIVYSFEDINYNEKGVELDRLTITAKQEIKHPLGISINSTTYSACKKLYPALKKSNEPNIFKFQKNKTWYFLEFNKQKVLTKIISTNWDTDMSS